MKLNLTQSMYKDLENNGKSPSVHHNPSYDSNEDLTDLGIGMAARRGSSRRPFRCLVYLCILIVIGMAISGWIRVTKPDGGSNNSSFSRSRGKGIFAGQGKDSSADRGKEGTAAGGGGDKSSSSSPKLAKSQISDEAYQEYIKIVTAAADNVKSLQPEFRSSYQCLGKQTDINARERRPCRFRNICFEKSSGEFLYYLPRKEPVFFDSMEGPLFNFASTKNPTTFIQLNSLPYGYTSHVTPKIVYGKPDIKGSSGNYIKGRVVLWASWSWEFNLGHFLFEELSSAFHILARFGIADRHAQLIDIRGDNDKERYKKLIHDFVPAISTNGSRGLADYVNSFQDDLVCFKELYVASATRAFLSPGDEYQFGLEPIWFQYRSQIMEHYQLDPRKNARDQEPLIVLIKKSKSLTKTEDQRTHFRDIYNFNEVVEHLKGVFGETYILVLDPSDLSISEQLTIISRTSILVTPPGGISMLIPFLPIDSHAIIMDYLGVQDYLVMTKAGESVSMEASLWNVFPHVIKHYYQIMDPAQDLVPDFKKATNTRDDYSVKISLKRIEFICNQAMKQLSEGEEAYL